MPPKRRHTKSRNGCMTCRRRRVKCDEIRPICTNCTRRELDCVYAAYCPPASIKPRRNGSTSTSSSSVPIPLAGLARQLDAILLGIPPRSPSSLPNILISSKDLDNLSLLHQFTIRTHKSFTNDGEYVKEIWRTKIPVIALQNDFAMHALLATTALHSSHTADTSSPAASRYQIIAARHYDRALSSLRTAILKRSSQNAEALFAASALIAIYAFACRTAPNETPRILTWIPLLRGITAITREWWPRVEQGDLSPIVDKCIRKSIEDGDFLTLPANIFHLYLPTPTPNIPPDQDELVDSTSSDIYKQAIDALRKVWNHFWTMGYQISSAFQWLVVLPEEFISLLREWRPRALVIFCHFLCMVKKLDGFWWIRGRAQEAFLRIERELGVAWRERWLEWPREIIFGRCETVGQEVL
ncbi:hypothetical protein L873DRAFT_1740733 [Choiromyces venosus 120613-1]|uniref:Zn(2)-C6 fungal-type domain-containing protein n=1 Tax=Choiromyces venosus 120613-1 TaxID=1336337 RepID=A0A3N4JJK9_9PEZI|nr:hypothetical protein L873DRAFT_1740733 [Choiromyces venosus 120613-1]